jgi:hypothetical protein
MYFDSRLGMHARNSRINCLLHTMLILVILKGSLQCKIWMAFPNCISNFIAASLLPVLPCDGELVSSQSHESHCPQVAISPLEIKFRFISNFECVVIENGTMLRDYEWIRIHSGYVHLIHNMDMRKGYRMLKRYR